ncbi:MAG: hypothetical protein ACOC7T_01740 [Planctomycetota bacterium]
MAIITVNDVLDHADRFEKKLAQYYEQVSRRTVREGVRMLTDYMSRHRRRIREVLAELGPEQTRRVRSTPLPFDPEAADKHCMKDVEIDPDASAEQVLDTAIRFDRCLMRLYRTAADESDDPQVREFFESLLSAEKRDAVRLQKIKAMDYF